MISFCSGKPYRLYCSEPSGCLYIRVWDCVRMSFGSVVVISKVLKHPQVVKTFENTFHFLSLN